MVKHVTYLKNIRFVGIFIE